LTKRLLRVRTATGVCSIPPAWRANFLGIVEMQCASLTAARTSTSSGTAGIQLHFGSKTARRSTFTATRQRTCRNNGALLASVGYDFGVGVTKKIIESRSWGARTASVHPTRPSGRDPILRRWHDSGRPRGVSSRLTYTHLDEPATIFSKPTTATSPINLSGYQQVSFWFQANATLAAGVLSLRLCSDTAGATTVDTLLLPAYPCANMWQCMTINKGSALGSTINSVALYAESDPGVVTVLLDNIIACKSVGSADSLTLDSLIGKAHNRSWVASTTYATNDIRIPTSANRNGFRYKATTGGTTGSTEPTWPEAVGLTVTDGTAVWTCEGVEDTWYPIQSIRGTTVLIDNGPQTGAASGRGYYGETETVATYKREPIKPAALASNSANAMLGDGHRDGGLAHHLLGRLGPHRHVQQSGQTWVTGQNGRGFAIQPSSNLNMNYALANFGFARYFYGFSMYSTSLAIHKLDSMHFVGLDSIPLWPGQGPVKILAKGLRCMQQR
jgi:hypothetical protein